MSMIIERKEDPGRKLTRAEALKKMETQKEKDKELVTGVFIYREHPNGTLRFRFHKYQEDGYPQYELEDGKIYKLPRMVVRHLNQNVHYRKYSHLSSTFNGPNIQNAADGRSDAHSNMYAIDKVPRCEFKSLEFMDEDIDMNPTNLSEVKKKF
jgi:hypothetical protein